jgi:hypothetical protein
VAQKKNKKSRKSQANKLDNARSDKALIERIDAEIKKLNGKIIKFDLKNQIVDIDCPLENKIECGNIVNQILLDIFGDDDME